MECMRMKTNFSSIEISKPEDVNHYHESIFEEQLYTSTSLSNFVFVKFSSYISHLQ